MIYGYIRVSSDRQTVGNQRFEIDNFCRREGLCIDGWIEETISGSAPYDKRKLGALLRRVRAGDLIVCSELSRLGRNLFMIMDILHLCMTRDCRVWTVKEDLIRRLLAKGVPRCRIAARCRVNRSTLDRFLKRNMMG